MEQLALPTVAVAFGVNVLTSVLKRWVYPRFGALGVQVTAFVLALIGAWYWLYGQNITQLSTIVTAAVALFSLAVALYEVILRHLPFFRVKEPEVEAARED